MKDTTRPRSDTAAGLPSVHYPARIALSEHAENYLNQLGIDLLAGEANLEQLPPSLLQLWTFAFEAGRQSQQPEVDYLNRENDRLYFECSIRQPKPVGKYQSWADLQEQRRKRQAEAGGSYPGGDLFAAWGQPAD